MKIVPLALAALLSLAAAPSHAEKDDRSKPVNIEADRVTVNTIPGNTDNVSPVTVMLGPPAPTLPVTS